MASAGSAPMPAKGSASDSRLDALDFRLWGNSRLSDRLIRLPGLMRWTAPIQRHRGAKMVVHEA